MREARSSRLERRAAAIGAWLLTALSYPAGLAAAPPLVRDALHGPDAGGNATSPRGGSAPSGPGPSSASSSPAVLGFDSFIGGTSTCPTPARVSAELESLIPIERLRSYQEHQLPRSATPAGAGPSIPIELIDLEARYLILFNGRVREYRDEGRDCAYRARVAAVFVALIVDPAAVVGAAEPPPPTAPPAAALPPAAPQPPAEEIVAERLIHLEVGPSTDHASGDGPDTTHYGGSLRFLLGTGAVRFVAGIMAFAPANATVNGIRLGQRHIPLDVGVRLRWRGLFFEPYAETGLTLALISEEAMNLQSNSRDSTLEGGAFASVGVRLWPRSRVSPFLSGRAEWVPRPSVIRSFPSDPGRTPTWWVGATAGLAVGF